MKDKIIKVNEVLEKGEPDNISYDSYGGYTGYKPQYVISAMNEVFGIGNWGFKELSMQLTETLAIAQVEVFFKDIEYRPTAWGQSRITKGDEGDARKGAQTDAIKKGLSYFGIGERAYFGLLPTPTNAHTTPQNAPRSDFSPKRYQDSTPVQNGSPATHICSKCGSAPRTSKTTGKMYCPNSYSGDKKIAGHTIIERDEKIIQLDEKDSQAEDAFLANMGI